MGAVAAVMTGKGVGAISTIQVFGESAEAVVEKLFRPAGGKQAAFGPGKILLGDIVEGGERIDQVTIGCEGRGSVAIHCHGNPLIVEMIVEALSRQGAEPVEAEELLARIYSAEEPNNTIAVEAKLVQGQARTVEGTRLVLNQIEGGLTKTVERWEQQPGAVPLELIKAEAAKVLGDSEKAKLLIFGALVVITGPANSGKSTLFNCLCGRSRAMVSDIKGTTRDWVNARCRIGALSAELVDTAGLDEQLAAAGGGEVERASQERAIDVLRKADLLLLVLDSGIAEFQLDERLVELMREKKVLTVLSKCDLVGRMDTGCLPGFLTDKVVVSAKVGNGIDSLVRSIEQICGLFEIEAGAAVCFTERQEDLLRQVRDAKSENQAGLIIRELLSGPLSL